MPISQPLRRLSMRILFLTQFFEPEPGAIRGLPFARWLCKRGHTVEVITGFPNYPGGKIYPGYRIKWRQREIIDGVSVVRVPLFPSHSRSALGRVMNYGSFMAAAGTIGAALAKSADILYVYHPPATVGIAGALVKSVRRIPIVYHIADMWPESVVESGMLGTGLMRSVVERALTGLCALNYRRADLITVLSPGFRRLLVARGVPQHKIHVVYNWTDDDTFVPVERNESLACELGFAGRFNVVYAGNLGPFQAIESLIHAAKYLDAYPRIQVVLVGAGQDRARLQEIARANNLHNVRFLTNRPYHQMALINALAEVLVVHLRDLPFFSATIPSKTQVAMACGRPILMAVRGDAAELVSKCNAGVVAEPENPEDIAQRIAELYRMPAAEREAMGRRGRDFYLQEMSLDVGGREMERLFERVAGSDRPSAHAVLARRHST